MTRSILRSSKLFAVVALSALAIACGDDDDDDGGNNPPPSENRIVTLTGAASIFPPAAVILGAGSPYDPGNLSNLNITLASALAELNPNNTNYLAPAEPLADGAGTNASFSVENVDADEVGIAVIAHLEPAAGATDPVQSHRVTTGILFADPHLQGDLPATIDTTVNGAPAFILPEDFETALAAEVEVDASTLVDEGYVLAFATTGTAGVSGATITLRNAVTQQDKTLEYTILYPTFVGGAGTSTDATGLAVIRRKSASQATEQLVITATVGSTSYSGQGGIKADTTFIAPLTAD